VQTGPQDAYLRIERLGKTFDSFVALSDVSLEIQRGEFVCFIGPSGCGKTTLLRLIAGLDDQTEGRIEQNGTEISHLPPEQRDFGIVFQSYALFPNLTIFENVAYGLVSQRRRRGEIQGRVEELLDMVGLRSERDKYPAQLSGGQQQRIAMVRALATSPGLLLLDEPLSALDARVRVELRARLKELQRSLGVTTIMVTHDQSEALTIADRIVVLNRGRIEQVGSPSAVYLRPANPFVSDFLGTSNFLDATVSRTGAVEFAGSTIACESGDLPVGAAVTLAIRPESVGVRNVRPGDENALPATIRELDFNGSFYRARLSTRLDATFLADFSANAVEDLKLEVGQELVVTLPRKYLIVYPRRAG
jgi:iron(III) transport system ATP-binding protein